MQAGLDRRLQELRLRAGSPTYREIERLLERQGRQERIARSTIQEKFTGKSTLKLGEVLRLVEALAEHARFIGAPLPPQETDQEAWRQWVVSAQASHSTPEETKAAAPANIDLEWPLDPLYQAGMLDVVEIVLESRGQPTANWLPRVAREMMRAEMSCMSFMRTAAMEPPLETVKTAAALHQEFPNFAEPDTDDPWALRSAPGNSETVLTLLRFTARKHGSTAAPTVVAGLRRAGIGEYVEHLLICIGQWHLAPNIEKAVSHLRAAEMNRDANNLLALTGSQRILDRTFEIAEHFNKTNAISDRDTILRAMATDPLRMLAAFEGSKDWPDAEKIIDTLILLIHPSNNADFCEAFQENEDFKHLAVRLGGWSGGTGSYPDEPPF
ncbi:hypothetical protein GCM10010363_38750 [Streptomyces omiyaensis]|uniref:hypothetical protein n=1 Tax=Streptomyces omiyaensis TaxID=68247 RepID=UPI0016755F3D|nr:hypothetical protein [Streptomyces omiyaensis]GGY53834.1 hypothetical protein GCM10010363_38750 [Streptomyces omiyaensis]